MGENGIEMEEEKKRTEVLFLLSGINALFCLFVCFFFIGKLFRYETSIFHILRDVEGSTRKLFIAQKRRDA